MTHLPRLASLVYGQPHFILPSAGLAIAGVINAARAGLELPAATPQPGANRFIGEHAFDKDTRLYKGYRMSGTTAIFNVIGELVNRGAWLGTSSGLVSYEGLAHALRAAASDSNVKSILLDVNSPGGQAGGMTEIAALVRKIAAEKPVAAIANTMMCSAAYGLCSGATRIVTTELGVVGSIGVVVMHADYSRALDEDGITVTLIHEGAHKVDGNPFEPLPADVRDSIQAETGKYYDAFIKCVVAGRTHLDAKSIRATEARTFLGSESVDAGLSDSVGTFEEVLADLESAAKGATVFAPPRRAGVSASQVELSAAPSAPLAGPVSSDSDNPILEPEPMAAAAAPATDKTHSKAEVDAATSAAAAAARGEERARVKAILGHPSASGQPKLAAHLAYETDMSADAAGAMLATAAPAAAAKPDTPAATAKPAAGPVLGGLELAAPPQAADGQQQPAAKKQASARDIYAQRAKARSND